jgi:hypothetical protein
MASDVVLTVPTAPTLKGLKLPSKSAPYATAATEPVIGKEPVEVTTTALTPGLEIVTEPVIGSDPVAVIITALTPGLDIVTDPVIGSEPVVVIAC